MAKAKKEESVIESEKTIVEEVVVSSDDVKSESTSGAQGRKKRPCYFCESKKEPTYTDSSALRKFISDRSRIYPRAKTGACSKHQRRVTKEIKYARHLSLLPFVNQI